MKVIVTRKFINKHTGKLVEKGDMMEVTADRYAEIMSKGNYVVRVAEDAYTAPETGETKDSIQRDEKTVEEDSVARSDGLDIMSVQELKEYASTAHKLTFKRGMKKTEIIEAIRRMEHGK